MLPVDKYPCKVPVHSNNGDGNINRDRDRQQQFYNEQYQCPHHHQHRHNHNHRQSNPFFNSGEPIPENNVLDVLKKALEILAKARTENTNINCKKTVDSNRLDSNE